MSILDLPENCASIRPIGTKNDIGDNIRVLYCASILNGDSSLNLKSAKRTAKYLGLDLHDWSWDEAVDRFEANGREVKR